MSLFRATQDQTKKLLLAAGELPPSSPEFLTVDGGLSGNPPTGFAHDLSRSEIGRGPYSFEAAREAFLRWEEFDLGWLHVVNPSAKVAPGELVAVEARAALLWSISISRVVEAVDTPTRFGFVYATTAFHVEEGQERFVISLDPESGSVSYVIEAVSRPRHILTRIGYPISRQIQHRFARNSHARIRRCVSGT